MMDPLSITTGTLALLGACATVSKTFAKIRCLKEAPVLIQVMNNEISDLQLMLVELDNHLERTESRNFALSNTDKAVFRLCISILGRSKDKILEIDSLIQYQLFKEGNDTGVRVSKRAFMRYHNKFIKFQAELRELRQIVVDIGNVLGARDISRIEVTVNDMHSNLAMLSQGHNRIEEQLERLTNPQSIASSSSSKASQGKKSQTSSNTPSGIEISVSRIGPAISSIKCTCVRQEASTYLRTFLGTLFLGYTATPTLRRNKQVCLYHQQTEYRVGYFFPFWFLKYAIWIRVASPVQCKLSFIQIIPRDHVVLDMIQYGDVEGIKKLFVSGQVSIKAQMPNGASLLHVSPFVQTLN